MAKIVLRLGALLVLLCAFPREGRAIVLCDGDCRNVTDLLEICIPDDSNRIPLPVMGFFPCNVPDFRARGLTVAAQMAVEAVLNDTGILPEYRLELRVDNTRCDRLAAVRAFINQLMDPQVRYMIVGPGCSTGALTIAETAPFYNLTQISYTATSISLSDTGLYPTFLRTISSDNASIATIGALVGEYGWQQVAIITHLNELFTNLSAVMERAFNDKGISVIREGLSFTPGVTSTRDIVERLSGTGARIVVLNAFESFAREIFCSAYRRGLVFPDYVFISYYFYSAFWWTDPITIGSNYMYTPENCTVLELTTAIYRSLAVDYFPIPTPEEEDQPTDVGYSTPNAFWEDFRRQLDILGYLPSEALRQASYTYDAVWAAAFALHNASETLKGVSRSLTEFTYDSDDINAIILQAALALNFQGVSGRVAFNRFGDREPLRQMYQYRFVGEVDQSTIQLPFAIVDDSTGLLKYTANESPSTVFPDGVPQAVEELFVHIALFILYTILCVVGVVFAIVCIVFNLVFRKKRIVKLSSPYLNVLIIVGAIFFYVDVILFGIDENIASFTVVDGLCQARIWIVSVGFSLFFGTILAKTFRVYYIFRNIKLKQKPIKDWILFIIVAVLIGIDLVFLIIVTPIWRLKLTRILIPREGGQVPFVIDQCLSDAAIIWIPVLLAYKAIALIVGIFLGIQTFKVKIKELNDSQFIFFSVLSIAVVSIVIGVISFLIVEPNAAYALLGFFIMITVTGILILLFGTRMVQLYVNPSGEVTLSTAPASKSTTLAPPQSTIDIDGSEDRSKIAELKKTIKSLKEQIKAATGKNGARGAILNTDNGEDKGSRGMDLEMESLQDRGGQSQDINAQNSNF